MTLFGYLWLVIVICCFLRKDMKYMAFITLLFMCFQSANVLYFNNRGVGPQILTSIMFIARSVLNHGTIIRIAKDRKKNYVDIFLLLLLGVVLYSSVKNDVLEERTLAVIQLIVYVVCFICMERTLKGMGEAEIYSMIRGITIIILTIGVLQWLTAMKILNLRDILKVLVYNDNGSSVAFNSQIKRLYSTFMEPSYFAGFVVGAFYYFFSISTKWKENIILMCGLFIELLLSKSSAAFGAFLVVGIVFVAVSRNIDFQWKIAIIACGVMGFLFLYFGFYELLDSVIFSKADTGSYRTRLAMNNRAMRAFQASPWYGTGYKSVRGSSIVNTLLGQLGMSGLALYLIVNIKIFAAVLMKKQRTFCSVLYDGARFGLLSAVACQVIACPDVDLCTYWFWMYAVAAHFAVSGKESIARKTGEVVADERWNYKAQSFY